MGEDASAQIRSANPVITRVFVGVACAAVVAAVAVGFATDWAAEEWAAAAEWLTAGVAVAAGVIAVRQLAEARKLRIEQAQPYVAVFMELSRPNAKFIDLVVRNFGATAAVDVEISLDPTPTQAVTDGAELWLPDRLPVLVPGQEWRTMWDGTIRRHEAGLPDAYTATTRYKDLQGRPSTFTYELRWEPYFRRGSLVTYGEHDAANALREIRKLMKRWTEGQRGLAVFTRDGDARDERRRAAVAEHREQPGPATPPTPAVEATEAQAPGDPADGGPYVSPA
jgi:hypothetical protein